MDFEFWINKKIVNGFLREKMFKHRNNWSRLKEMKSYSTIQFIIIIQYSESIETEKLNLWNTAIKYVARLFLITEQRVRRAAAAHYKYWQIHDYAKF